jgi:hypothetical protein
MATIPGSPGASARSSQLTMNSVTMTTLVAPCHIPTALARVPEGIANQSIRPKLEEQFLVSLVPTVQAPVGACRPAITLPSCAFLRLDKIATRYAQVYFVHSGYVLPSQPLCRKGNPLPPNPVPGGTRSSAPTQGSRLTGYGCLAARRLPCSCAFRSLSPDCSGASPTTSPGDRARIPARYD